MDIFKKNQLIFSLILALLVIICGSVGIFTPDFYYKESQNWQAQSLGQDFINVLLIVPTLITSSLLAFKKNKISLFLWSGTLLYLIYTFIIYCLSLHFNRIFILYCHSLGISFYLFSHYFISICTNKPVIKLSEPSRIKYTAIYLMTVATLFYFLWLSEVLPASIKGTIPPSIVEAGLITNPVHALDLSLYLPGIFFTGILLLKRRFVGIILTPAFLIFFILMNCTIAALTIMMKLKGLEAPIILCPIMGILALVSLKFLISFSRSLNFS